MRRIITLALSIIFTFQIEAQVSIIGAYSTFSADKWDMMMDIPTEGFVAAPRSMSPFSPNIMYGLSYSIPIPNVGMRLLPELNYTMFSSTGWDDVSSLDPNERIDLTVNLTNIAFLLNTNIYLLNLEGDCDCPTFGKDGGFFEKGFHIQGGPGLVFTSKQTKQEAPSIGEIVNTVNNTNFAFVIGAGLDIGLTEKFTITPFARYKWISPSAWTDLANLLSAPEPIDDNSSSMSSLETGIKIGFRYKN